MAYVDWIKIEHTTPRKEEVMRIASILKINPYEVVGRLIELWIWADQNTTNGRTFVRDLSVIDHLTGKDGFGQAMKTSGWLKETDDGFEFPNFLRHNGKSAKKRADSARSKKRNRTNVPTTRGQMSEDEQDVVGVTSSSTSTSTSSLDIDSNNLNNKEDENENYAKPAIQPIEEWLSDFPEEVRKPAVQAAIAYQTRRYGGPNPGASWYRELLREAASVLEVQPNLQDSLERFKAACLAKPTPALSRQATFSDIALSIGIKKPRAPNGEPALKTKDELIAYFAEGMKV